MVEHWLRVLGDGAVLAARRCARETAYASDWRLSMHVRGLCRIGVAADSPDLKDFGAEIPLIEDKDEAAAKLEEGKEVAAAAPPKLKTKPKKAGKTKGRSKAGAAAAESKTEAEQDTPLARLERSRAQWVGDPDSAPEPPDWEVSATARPSTLVPAPLSLEHPCTLGSADRCTRVLLSLLCLLRRRLRPLFTLAPMSRLCAHAGDRTFCT